MIEASWGARMIPSDPLGSHGSLGAFWCENVDGRLQLECVTSSRGGNSVVRTASTSGTSCVVASTTDDYPGAAWGPNHGLGGDPQGNHPSWLLFYITVLEFQCDSDDFQKKMINNWDHLSPVSLPGPLSAHHILYSSALPFMLSIFTGCFCGQQQRLVRVALLVWPSLIAHMNYH